MCGVTIFMATKRAWYKLVPRNTEPKITTKHLKTLILNPNQQISSRGKHLANMYENIPPKMRRGAIDPFSPEFKQACDNVMKLNVFEHLHFVPTEFEFMFKGAGISKDRHAKLSTDMLKDEGSFWSVFEGNKPLHWTTKKRRLARPILLKAIGANMKAVETANKNIFDRYGFAKKSTAISSKIMDGKLSMGETEVLFWDWFRNLCKIASSEQKRLSATRR